MCPIASSVLEWISGKAYQGHEPRRGGQWVVSHQGARAQGGPNVCVVMTTRCCLKGWTMNERRTKKKKMMTTKRDDNNVWSKNPNCCNCYKTCPSQKRPRIDKRQKSDAISLFDVFRTAAWDGDDYLFLSAFKCANCMGWKVCKRPVKIKMDLSPGMEEIWNEHPMALAHHGHALSAVTPMPSPCQGVQTVQDGRMERAPQRNIVLILDQTIWFISQLWQRKVLSLYLRSMNSCNPHGGKIATK